MQHLRFCHLSTFYPPFSFGGDAIFLYHLANGLAARGHEVDIIHCADSYRLLSSSADLVPWPHHPRVTVHTLQSRLGALSPLLTQQTGWPWLKAKKIRRILGSKKFDVIHHHNTSLLGPKIFEIRPEHTDYIRLYTAHEHWLICPMHVLWKDNDHLCDQPRCFRCSLKYRLPPQLWRYTNLLSRSAEHIDAFLSTSRFSIDLHRQRGFLKPFVYLPCFTPSPGPLAEAAGQGVSVRPYFLFVGRLEKIKGLQNVIPVFRNYKKASLLIAGKGDYEPELRRLARGLDHVNFLGWIPPSQLPVYYRQAIALIVPSICYEVFPGALLEAFANRTPAVVNSLGPLPEIIRECQGGRIYGDQEQLPRVLDQLQSDESLRNQLGENAHQQWSEHWSEDAHIRQYSILLNEIAQRKFGRIPWSQPE